TLCDGMVMSNEQINNFHPETMLALSLLPSPIEPKIIPTKAKTPVPISIPVEVAPTVAAKTDVPAVTTSTLPPGKSSFALFVEHNEKFILSFFINAMLVVYILRLRRGRNRASIKYGDAQRV
ncbi:MAG: hypothetical protein Q8K92_13610, partial [Leadbetterella sp.]|nr:hypothetical protein [Leadbetterella sp.]